MSMLTLSSPSPLVGEGARGADEGVSPLASKHGTAQHPSPGFPLDAQNHPLPQGERVGSVVGART